MRVFFLLTFHSLRELLRERILYNTIFVALFLLFFGYLAALLVFGHQDRVMLHFGTLVNALCVYVVSTNAGARATQSEIENRTVYLLLSRPISRGVYFFSKWVGIGAFTFLNLILLGAVLAKGLSLTGGHFQLATLQSFSLIWVESLVMIGFSLLFSQFLRPGLTVMVTLSYFFIAHNHEQMRFLSHQASPIFALFAQVTPDGQVFLMDTRVYYEMPLAALEWAQRMGYGFLWALFFMLIGNAVFYRKNL